MSTFAEWNRGVKAGRAQRRLHYVTGSEDRLREIVVSTLRSRPAVADRVTVTATGSNDSEVWDEMNQYPSTSRVPNPVGKGTLAAVRHVTVRDAHKVRSWRQLDGWLQEMRSVTACFETAWPSSEFSERASWDFTIPLSNRAVRCPRGHKCTADGTVTVKRTQSGGERRWCTACLEVREMLVGRAHLVICAKPSTQHQRVEAAWIVAGWADSSPMGAGALLDVCDWSVSAAWEATQKLRMMHLPLTPQTIAAAAPDAESGSYEKALRSGNRARAAELARLVPPDRVPSIIGSCERWLGQVSRAVPAVRASRTPQELTRLLSCDWRTAEALIEDATRYTSATVSRAVAALAEADAAWSSGARIGVLEELSASW